MARRGKRRLYADGAEAAERRAFVREYGPEKGPEYYGATVGKVAREQAAESPSGVKLEQVPGHIAMSSRGKPYRVRPHTARIVAHPHSHGEHSGPCSAACRRGEVGHPHKRQSRRSRY